MKTKTRLFTAILFLITTSLSSCSDQDINKSTVQTDQQVFFEVSYINQAWGKQFKGFIINKDGQIRTYDNPAKWNSTDGKTGLTLSQIQENIAGTVLSKTNVSTADLQNYTAKISSIAGSEFTKPVSGGADRGITSFYAYRYDQDKKVYTPVLLSQTGDVETYNKDKSAVDISTWLTGILAKVY